MTFTQLMNEVVSTYGVSYGVYDEENVFPTTYEEEQDAWFICPECGEPQYGCDWYAFGDDGYICTCCELSIGDLD